MQCIPQQPFWLETLALACLVLMSTFVMGSIFLLLWRDR